MCICLEVTYVVSEAWGQPEGPRAGAGAEAGEGGDWGLQEGLRARHDEPHEALDSLDFLSGKARFCRVFEGFWAIPSLESAWFKGETASWSARRYASAIKTFVCCLLYQPVFPLISLVGIVGLAAQYWIDKHLETHLTPLCLKRNTSTYHLIQSIFTYMYTAHMSFYTHTRCTLYICNIYIYLHDLYMLAWYYIGVIWALLKGK